MADYVLEILSHYTIDKPGTETNRLSNVRRRRR
jgi:hypothetical protein